MIEIEKKISAYISTLSEEKKNDLTILQSLILKIAPNCKLWFLDGKNESGKVVSNPNIGYGVSNISNKNNDVKEFYRIGLSTNTMGISIYVMGLDDKNYLTSLAEVIGKAKVTSYCIKFKTVKEINLDALETIIKFAFCK